MNDRGRDPTYSPLKAAWRHVVQDLGGVAAMERHDITRVGAARLSSYGLVHESAFVPVDVARDAETALVEAGGEPHLLKAYAEALGFVVIRKDAIANPLPVLDQAAVEAIGAVGQLATKFYEAARDGVITPVEAGELVEVGTSAGGKVTEFTEAARARSKRGAR